MLLTAVSVHRDAVIAVLAVINIASLCVCAYDKKAAISKGARVPEKLLLLLSFFFGSTGMFLGMYIFRHKTRKPLFFVTVPLMLVIHAVLLYAAGIIS